VIRAVGGLENAIKLLIAVMVAAKVASFATAITAIGTNATAAATRVGTLRTVLSRLALISAIAIPITVFLNRKQITREFNKITDSLPDWARGKEVKIPIDKQSLAQLRETRKQFEGMGGDSGKVIAAIDAQIRKLRAAQTPKGTAPSKAIGIGEDRRVRLPSSVSATTVVESHVTVQLDNDVVGRAVTRSQQKTARRNPRQKRGPNTGI
jgi:hypothetical protein